MYVCVCACIISPFSRRKSNMFHFFCWPPREFRISELDPYEASLAGSTRGYSRTPRNGWKLSFIQLQLESALSSSDPSGSPDVLSPSFSYIRIRGLKAPKWPSGPWKALPPRSPSSPPGDAPEARSLRSLRSSKSPRPLSLGHEMTMMTWCLKMGYTGYTPAVQSFLEIVIGNNDDWHYTPAATFVLGLCWYGDNDD